MKLFRASAFLLAILLTFSACKKDDDTNNDADSTATATPKAMPPTRIPTLW